MDFAISNQVTCMETFYDFLLLLFLKHYKMLSLGSEAEKICTFITQVKFIKAQMKYD